ncbi:MAG: pilus (MSHA type) biogenesis protein MshL [Rhodocyclaceae bacterium]|nr:pilus (MSHA type) biogenesis protein MshL [Rhodocyclaceae bacterium]MBX3668892.1 pilus (MSHA type) biogenesis protein MshL [Rhodocyclaceae bacterium]
MLAACATSGPQRGATLQAIESELAKAAQSRPAEPRPPALDAALLPPLPPAAPREPRFDLAVQGAPAAQVFMAIVNGTRYSMVVHPEVSGTLTLNLKDVTVDEALDTIRELYGYDYRRQGTRIMILPLGLQTRVFQINYLAGRRHGMTDMRVTSGSISAAQSNQSGSAAAATPLPLPSSSTPGGTQRTQDSSRIQTTTDTDFWGDLSSALRLIVGSEQGRNVIVNAQSGVILVKAHPAELRQVERYLQATQVVVERQVMLEAKILEVQLSDGFQSGINWTYFGSNGSHRTSLGANTNTLPLPGGGVVSSSGTGATLGETLGAGLVTAAGRSAGGLFGLAFQTGSFSAMLQFLQTQGAVQVLSSPRIATINNQKAVLKVGTDEFFVTNVSTTTNTAGNNTTTSPTITVQPFFSGIALDVTPQIDEQNHIILHVHPSISAVAEKTKQLNLGTLGNFTLPLASSSVNESDSVVRVQDGHIVAIGGLMTQADTRGHSRVPGLGDLPAVGALFGQKDESTSKRELVILLKPTLIQSEQSWQQDLADTAARVQRFGAAQ